MKKSLGDISSIELEKMNLERENEKLKSKVMND